MRSFFTLVSLVITFLILTACSSQQVTVTSAQQVTVTSTPLPIPTGTPVPSATPTATPTIVTYSADIWGPMDETAKYAAVPVSPEYSVKGLSTLEGKGQYVILKNPEELPISAYDSQTGEIVSLSDAGIKIIELTDGSEFEMMSFKTAEEALDFMSTDAMWWGGEESIEVRFKVKSTAPNSTKNLSEIQRLLKIIPDINDLGLLMLPLTGENFTRFVLNSQGGGSIFRYINSENMSVMRFVEQNADVIDTALNDGTLTLTPPTQ